MTTPKITPTLSEVMRTAIDSYFERFFTTLVCRVESYDVDTQEADLKPVSLVKVFNEDGELVEEELPVLASIPVAFPRAGDWFVSMPVAVGDTMTVVIASRDYEDWRERGSDTVAEDVRVNPLNAAIAIPNNIYSKDRALSNAHASKMVVGKDTGARIYVSDDQINIYEENAAQFVALAQLTYNEISALRNTVNNLTNQYNNHSHPIIFPNIATPPAVVGSVAATKVKAT